jgi:hypothetical protein
MIRPARLIAAALLLTALAPPPTLDHFAERYVKLSLEAGEREPEYVDAYYGPPEWAAAAKADPRDLPTLLKDARALKAELLAVEPMSLVPSERRRLASLLGQVTAAETRLAMANGTKFSFADEARGLFGTAPDLQPLSSYDAVLAEIERLVPGTGPLDERVSRYRESLRIPPDKLRAVMDAAIAECRRRTIAHIPLPGSEKFTLGIVTGKPWGGYNYYKGNATSLIEVNTDLPVLVDRAVDLGCHEGYPGHHVLNVLLEEKLSKGKGWQEFTVYPLYSPQSLLAEGSANYGIELAFPGEEQARFEAEVIFPLAGLDPKEAPRLAALNKASRALAGSRFTIARDYLDGRITREQAIAATQKYGLTTRARAEKSLEFTDHYRSYVINYGHGRDLVRTTVEAAGPDAKARWTRMEQLLSEPTTPADLGAR